MSKESRGWSLSAPSASPPDAAYELPGSTPPVVRHHPPLDARLVTPETRDEMVQGQRVKALPALAPYADRHCELDYVVRATVAPGYAASADMLTRVEERSDFATDTSMR
jgi:hypothetical protein